MTLVYSAVPYEAIVPEHTRYALFQLYCDLRANPPRDRHWFMLHARRLRPHTVSGWIVCPLLSSHCMDSLLLCALGDVPLPCCSCKLIDA